ncbi:hypothetical protein MKX70_08600 [Paenibacillus sp. FSL R7-0312]|uniref:hypothetical protein n=1 Tax=unclassified Paenibacillus TaxID=185978 RepID=UPI0004F61300|nr:hypothetical protein [Paenibacillus sp. FSL R5-0912]AIQ43960.1 hypothetical protein R50912_31200 [Paenibacillus sp. FSL R5-0912]
MKKVFIFMFVITSLFSFSNSTSSNDLKAKSIQMNKFFRAWQGVGADKKYIYVTSDRDTKFSLSNTISVYDVSGKYVVEKQSAYTGKDKQGRFMSFGDCFVSNSFLYATVYNFNSAPPINKRISRVVKYSLPDLKLIEEYDIGQGTAESLATYKGSFWVVYHDRNEVKRFDSKFRYQATYPLSAKFGGEGGYQGIFFKDNELYGNLHGSNQNGKEYAQGLDHYKFNGNTFEFIERIKVPTYGAGQGVEKVENKVYWVDRPANKIIITNEFL